MKLKNAARFFDTCPVYDAYSGALLFKAQTSTFLESSVEGSTAARRVISVAPEVTIPTHSCILALQQLLLIGASNPDEWAGSTIRAAYWTKRVTDSFKLLTPAEACNNAAGTVAYGQRQYLRETINTQTDSELDPMWNIFLSKSLSPVTGYFLKGPNTLYRIRLSYEDIDGFRTCQSDEVTGGTVAITVTGSNTTYNPVTDTYTPVSYNSTGIVLDYHKSFTRRTQGDYKVESGDVCLVVPKASVVAVQGMELTIQAGSKLAGKWRVLDYLDEVDSWNLHIRRR